MISRRKLVFFGVAAAAVIGTSSVAFACLTFKGQITLTGGTGGAGDTVKGANAPMANCYGPTKAAATSRTAGVGTVQVVVAATAACSTTQLPQGSNYTVALQDDNQTSPLRVAWQRTGAGAAWQFTANNGCWGPNKPATRSLSTTFSVDATGAGSGTYTMPSGVPVINGNNAGGICVGNPVAGNGAFAPLQLN